MSYESAMILFSIFIIPTTIFVIISVIRLKLDEKADQADLELMFSLRMDD